MIHGILIPTSKKSTKKSNGKKNMIKYSITDSQSTFIYVCHTAAGVDEHIQNLISTNENIQPFIIIIASDILYPQEILVYVDGIKYKFFNILNAIDICFKIFHLFNIKYPIQCESVWQFIQCYFYEIKSKSYTYPSVSILCNEISVQLQDNFK